MLCDPQLRCLTCIASEVSSLMVSSSTYIQTHTHMHTYAYVPTKKLLRLRQVSAQEGAAAEQPFRGSAANDASRTERPLLNYAYVYRN